MSRGQTVELYRRRIRSVYNRTSARRRRDGRDWYGDARRQVRRLARTYGLPLRPVAAIVAAISPGCRWDSNIEHARRVIEAASQGAVCPTVPTYNQGWAQNAYNLAREAFMVRDLGPGLSANWQWWERRIEEWRVVSGPKRTAFYRLLLDGGNDQDVCVDGHAGAMVWTPSRDERPTSKADTFSDRASGGAGGRDITPYQYSLIADAFRAEARELGLQPCQLQATTWLEWREM